MLTAVRAAAVAVILAAPAAAQQPTRFRNQEVRLESRRGGWSIAAGGQTLREFGASYNDAGKALRAIRAERFDSFASVGKARPPFEVWLADGQPPGPPSLRSMTMPFDVANLRVAAVGSMWCLRDGKRIVFNFGDSKADAERALAVCKQYGFNLLVLIGSPEPKMTYLARDDRRRRAPRRSTLLEDRLKILNAGGNGGPKAVTLPKAGHVGTATAVSHRLARPARVGREWVVRDARAEVAKFGNSLTAAREFARLLNARRVTEVVHLDGLPLKYLARNGRPVVGLPLGAARVGFLPKRLTVERQGDGYTLIEGQRVVLNLAGSEAQARRLLGVIRHHRFDSLVRLGRPPEEGVWLLMKAR